jgi:cobalt/nickel transport system permease protein
MIGVMARIDHLASRGGTVWHRASALSKLILALLVLALALATRSLALLGALYALAAALALTSRLPLRLVAIAAGYPIVFSGLFLVSAWDGTWQTPARLLLRPLAASLIAVWLVGTTPYPDLFAPLSRVLPRSVGDGLFLTYRALFDIGARGERLWRAMRLRGGAGGANGRRLAQAGDGFATLVLYAFERSQRQYATMRLRGYQGRICGCRHYAELTPFDGWVALVAALVVTAACVLWRSV